MAPRKKTASSSSKKSNQSLHQSQPTKFGIQHFFERHSQTTSSTPSNPPDPPNPPNPNPNPNPKPSQDTSPIIDPPEPAAPSNAEEKPSPISPEFVKSASLKRFKFSPGMLIKQSQDDGGDEVTWKISPMHERLRSFTGKNLPGTIRGLSDDSKPGSSSLCPCSQEKVNNDTPCSVGKLEKWLSSPATKVPKSTLGSSKRVSCQETELSDSHGCNGDPRNPFQTPPSVLYGPGELIGSVVSKGSDVTCDEVSDKLGSRQHCKALLDLLDQVETAITIEEHESDNSRVRVLDGHKEMNCETHLETDFMKKMLPDIPLESVCSAPSVQSLLVLEVSEKHRTPGASHSRQPFKVLRLLDEQSGKERALHLCDDWFYSIIAPGNTVNIIGEFDEKGECVVDHHNNLVIVHPDILVSATRVASSFCCPRRAVLDERLKCVEYATSALYGTLLHQIFQAGLRKDIPTKEYLEECASSVIEKNIESLYACGVHENDTCSTLTEAIPRMLNWLNSFKERKDSRTSNVDFGQCDGDKSLSITEVIDIEEIAWAPRYGLKGIIDASVRVRMESSNGASDEKTMPLEFKTGKATSGQSMLEHSAQVILYTLVMSERYLNKDIDSGILYYLHTDQTRGIKVQRSDMVGLIMRRNELASDILKASTVQLLPPMLRNQTMCKGCRHLKACTVYHKAHGGNNESSGLADIYDFHVEHLTIGHCDFLQHWERLIDVEAKASKVSKKELLRPHCLRRENNTNCISSVILEVNNELPIDGSSKDGRFIYHFVCQDSPLYDSIKHEEQPEGAAPLTGNMDCTLRCGDYVILSTLSGRIAVANGIITDLSRFRVSVSLSRRLRLPGSSPSQKGSLIQEVWRIDKDEITSSFAIMRFNLIQLFTQGSQSSHLRKLIVDLEAPRYDSGGIFSQDPAISYVRSEKNLNDDQRRAIQKILSAKDYALILGMPGTGKTSTMVHAVKALLIRGASILLTSYTNSAVDNLLLKLKAQGIDFLRIGRREAIHEDVCDHCFSAWDKCTVKDIQQRMDHVRVVGVTCLGINHPLLANKRFDICIMDEAGQITLPVSIGPLMLASTFVLVGDHYQLPPLVQSVEARENGMGISLFCRLSEANPQAISALQCQYRMCAGIMELSNALIYGNRLRCGSSDIANAKLSYSSVLPLTSWLKEVLDPNKSVVFVNTDMLPAPEVKEHRNVNNPTEAYIVSEIVGEMVCRDVSRDELGVITPYNSQANLIRRHVGTAVEIHTIDKYQGRDKDCILVSFVRSSENSKACSSSLLGDWHRINVALTRAKKKLIMVGSCRTLSKVPLLKLLIEKVDEQAGILNISNKDIHPMRVLKKCSETSVHYNKY